MLQFMKAPIFEDEKKTNEARLLNAILWALILVPIPYALYFWQSRAELMRAGRRCHFLFFGSLVFGGVKPLLNTEATDATIAQE